MDSGSRRGRDRRRRISRHRIGDDCAISPGESGCQHLLYRCAFAGTGGAMSLKCFSFVYQGDRDSARVFDQPTCSRHDQTSASPPIRWRPEGALPPGLCTRRQAASGIADRGDQNYTYQNAQDTGSSRCRPIQSEAGTSSRRCRQNQYQRGTQRCHQKLANRRLAANQARHHGHQDIDAGELQAGSRESCR